MSATTADVYVDTLRALGAEAILLEAERIMLARGRRPEAAALRAEATLIAMERTHGRPRN